MESPGREGPPLSLIHILSRRLGLPEKLIQDAGERLSKDQVRFEDVIANAEYHRQVAQKERELAEQAHQQTQQIRDEADRLRRELEEQRSAMLKKAREEARQVDVYKRQILPPRTWSP